jgi:hypothetical protein
MVPTMSNFRPRRAAGVTASIVAALSLVSCTSNSQPLLNREARHLLHPGMRLTQAENLLEARAFTCGKYALGYARTCIRLRNYLIVATCVQRINLASDGAQTLSRFDVPMPACTSL